MEDEVKGALGSITMNKASGGNGIPAELFQILKDDAVKVLHSICQQIWKAQQWPQDWKWSVFYFCSTDYTKAFDHVDYKKLWKIFKDMVISDDLTCP